MGRIVGLIPQPEKSNKASEQVEKPASKPIKKASNTKK